MDLYCGQGDPERSLLGPQGSPLGPDSGLCMDLKAVQVDDLQTTRTSYENCMQIQSSLPNILEM